MVRKRNIVRLSITLLHVEPKVARRMDVYADTTLEELHYYLQAAMGWENCHLWGFDARRYGERAHWGDDEFGEGGDQTILDVLDFLRGNADFTYIYDYGDSWTHRIRIGKIQPARTDRRYPYLVSGVGRCPLEDIGGAWGYWEFLQAFKDPDSEYREYYPGYFEGDDAWDPEDAQLGERRAELERYSS